MEALGVRPLPTTPASPQGGSIASRDSTTDFSQLPLPTAHYLTCGSTGSQTAPHHPCFPSRRKYCLT
ncbi:hypothetical protein E2C01_090920 [Portunus trituberculatus]|uniref:Uncharacterized protein n=1 Tax=Portunus trituberculatus TaxID=210409 RepID=A0A5B7JRF4_PORTR|nr:hypothetical protein [Portunus trituberculatus]